MNYESFRAEFIMHLQESGIENAAEGVLKILDVMADKYDITAKPTDLSIVSGLPELVKIYIASRSVENLSKETLRFYLTTLRAFFSKVCKPIPAITTNDIRVYLFEYKEKRNVKDSTLETIRVIIKNFFAWLTEEDYIQKNPAARIAAIKFHYEEREALTEIELARIRACCKDVRQRAMVDFLFSTGCRVSELRDMKIEDVNFQQKEVRILHGKGNKFRISFLNADSIVSLKAYLLTRKDAGKYLFPSIRCPEKQCCKRTIENEIHAIAQAAQIGKNVTPHTFRHTAATIALRRGMKLEEVQRFLGHSKITTTLIYAKLDNEATKASHQKYVS